MNQFWWLADNSEEKKFVKRNFPQNNFSNKTEFCFMIVTDFLTRQ
jgi:hypothetical protein